MADCYVPNTPAALAYARSAFSDHVIRRVPVQEVVTAPEIAAVLSMMSSTNADFCFIEGLGWAICTPLDPIEVTAPPPPPPLDDCSNSPDPYMTSVWCECWQYSEEPFWCAFDYDWSDYPIIEMDGGGSPSTTAPSYPPPGVSSQEYYELNEEEKRLCWRYVSECISVGGARTLALEWVLDVAVEDQWQGSLADNKYDAMRHAYWSAVMTRTMGAQRAEIWGTAHEWGQPLNNGSVCMDLANNASGRAVGANSWGQAYPYMRTVIRGMANADPPELQISPGC